MKPKHFWEIYQKELSPLSGRSIKLLELGVQEGESLRYWEMLLPAASIVGVDTNSECLKYASSRVKILHMNQTDTRIADESPFDVIVDDGGHKMSEQQDSFRLLFPLLRTGGMYFMEDVETSYWGDFIDRELTTIDFLKTLADSLNKEAILHTRSADTKKYFPPYELESVTFYQNLCLIKKY